MPLVRRLAPGLLVALAACAGAPPPAPKPAPADPSPPPAPTPLPMAAHWVESGGATLVGPAVAGGTLVLLGGRRAVLRDDGSLEPERVPAPEPLVEIAEVPAKGAMVLVARGAHGVYRFDDPLGPAAVLARSDDALVRIGAAPGVVAIWRRLADLPRFLDVETGADAPMAGLPAPPLHAVAFADAKRGAAVFEAVGLAVTADGGATWRIATDSHPGDALRAHGLRLRRKRGAASGARELHAYTYPDGPDGAVDVEAARLGPLEMDGGGQAPLLRWIRATGRDPLEAVASAGIDALDGRALVASHGLVARVDPRTGAIDVVTDLAKGKGVGPCGAARAGSAAWIACAVAEEGRDLFDPFGVVRVPLGDGTLGPATTVLVRNGEAELRSSPSGGLMLLAPCTSEDVGSACVRQPDGKWKTISIDGDLTERGAGPLADGRVAYLRGISDGDEGETPAPPSKGGAAPGEDDAPSKRLHVAITGLDGKEHHLPPIPFTPSRGYVRAQSPIEEDADHTLRLVVEDGEGPYVVVMSPGKDAGTAQRVPDAVAARLCGGRGIAVTEGRVLASLDGGGTWNEVPATADALDAARTAASSYDDPGELAVSELGAKVGPMLRLGWGPGDAAPAPAAAPPAPAPLVWNRPPSPAPQVLACTSQGTVAGTPPLWREAEARSLLEGATPRKVPGARRETSLWVGGRMLVDTAALLEEEGPEGHAPVKWTVRWLDPRELGGRVRSASIPVPKDAAWGTTLRFAAASRGDALFALRSSRKLRLVRVKAAGGVEIVEAANDAMPTADVVFGEGRSAAAAWAHEMQVFAWLPGERPRAIAQLAAHGTRVLGAPTPAGVPILLGASDWSLTRTLPIPPIDERRAEAAPALLALDGWTRLPPLPRRLDGLPACTTKSRGARFSVVRLALNAEVDGVREGATEVAYDLRVDGAEACLAGLGAALAPERGAAPATAKAPGKPAPPPAAFVRVDLAGKRAEGGERGLPPASMRRMTCALGQAKR